MSSTLSQLIGDLTDNLIAEAQRISAFDKMSRIVAGCLRSKIVIDDKDIVGILALAARFMPTFWHNDIFADAFKHVFGGLVYAYVNDRHLSHFTALVDNVICSVTDDKYDEYFGFLVAFFEAAGQAEEEIHEVFSYFTKMFATGRGPRLCINVAAKTMARVRRFEGPTIRVIALQLSNVEICDGDKGDMRLMCVSHMLMNMDDSEATMVIDKTSLGDELVDYVVERWTAKNVQNFMMFMQRGVFMGLFTTMAIRHHDRIADVLDQVKFVLQSIMISRDHGAVGAILKAIGLLGREIDEIVMDDPCLVAVKWCEILEMLLSDCCDWCGLTHKSIVDAGIADACICTETIMKHFDIWDHCMDLDANGDVFRAVMRIILACIDMENIGRMVENDECFRRRAIAMCHGSSYREWIMEMAKLRVVDDVYVSVMREVLVDQDRFVLALQAVELTVNLEKLIMFSLDVCGEWDKARYATILSSAFYIVPGLLDDSVFRRIIECFDAADEETLCVLMLNNPVFEGSHSCRLAVAELEKLESESVRDKVAKFVYGFLTLVHWDDMEAIREIDYQKWSIFRPVVDSLVQEWLINVDNVSIRELACNAICESQKSDISVVVGLCSLDPVLCFDTIFKMIGTGWNIATIPKEAIHHCLIHKSIPKALNCALSMMFNAVIDADADMLDDRLDTQSARLERTDLVTEFLTITSWILRNYSKYDRIWPFCMEAVKDLCAHGEVDKTRDLFAFCSLFAVCGKTGGGYVIDQSDIDKCNERVPENSNTTGVISSRAINDSQIPTPIIEILTECLFILLEKQDNAISLLRSVLVGNQFVSGSLECITLTLISMIKRTPNSEARILKNLGLAVTEVWCELFSGGLYKNHDAISDIISIASTQLKVLPNYVKEAVVCAMLKLETRQVGWTNIRERRLDILQVFITHSKLLLNNITPDISALLVYLVTRFHRKAADTDNDTKCKCINAINILRASKLDSVNGLKAWVDNICKQNDVIDTNVVGDLAVVRRRFLDVWNGKVLYDADDEMLLRRSCGQFISGVLMFGDECANKISENRVHLRRTLDYEVCLAARRREMTGAFPVLDSGAPKEICDELRLLQFRDLYDFPNSVPFVQICVDLFGKCEIPGLLFRSETDRTVICIGFDASFSKTTTHTVALSAFEQLVRVKHRFEGMPVLFLSNYNGGLSSTKFVVCKGKVMTEEQVHVSPSE